MEVATRPNLDALSRHASAEHVSHLNHLDEAARLMPPPAELPLSTAAAAAVKQQQSNAALTSPRRKPVPSAIETKVSPRTRDESTAKVGPASQGSNSSVSSSRATLGMTRSDSAQSSSSTAYTSASSSSKPQKSAKSKGNDLHHGHRNKSATGFHRAGRHSKSSDRIAPRQNSSGRLGNVFSGLAMTKAAPASGKAAKDSKKPVKFTMGGDDSDSFEDDAEQETPSQVVKADQQKPQEQQTIAEPVVQKPLPASHDADEIQVVQDEGEDDFEDDGDWSSDTEAEEAERRAQAAAQAARQRREEEDRQRSMFKKIPIRSKSAADVRMLTPEHQTSNGPSPPAQPVRGLLSSMFHPDEQHSPPGQLAGRPHASAADLRARPSLPGGLALTKMAPSQPKRPRHREPTASTSSSQGGPLAGGLRTSKSAVALPLLDMSVTRSSTAGKARQPSAPSPSKDQHHSAEEASSPESTGGKPSSVAMAKLNALTSMRSHADRNRKSSEADEAAAREAESRALRLEVSPSNDELESEGMSRSHSYLSASSSQAQQHRPFQGMTSRSKSEGPPEPIAAPGLARNRSNPNLPDAAAPQTPRTTRRNMLRDELSESLRQNLLWERQSRTRMLGIGAPVVPKKETVLGGHQLRPLTSARAPASQPQSQQHTKPKRYSEDWGSFHHTGW